ncbi:MAG TPA: molybdopterin cofactor-binding domain-containing protein, partial [Acidimicrobiales bacterium]|nr:molybdopterin cofactor-binding domain-containing protein [Acidimicrobiales bacterium]
QVHACVVEVDEETGEVAILEYAAVDDCGRRINPLLVEGQVHGATSHGISAALYESLDYDESGLLEEPSFYEYHTATALDVPDLLGGEIESPSPFTPNGAKGMGEGGGAPLHTVCSAIQDALEPGGPIVTDSHNHWERVWHLVHPAAGTARGVTVVTRGARSEARDS